MTVNLKNQIKTKINDNPIYERCLRNIIHPIVREDWDRVSNEDKWIVRAEKLGYFEKRINEDDNDLELELLLQKLSINKTWEKLKKLKKNSK